MTTINYPTQFIPLRAVVSLKSGAAFLHSVDGPGHETLYIKEEVACDRFTVRCVKLSNGDVVFFNTDTPVEPCDIEINVIRRTTEPM